MVEITVKMKVNADSVDEAEKWMEELSDNEMFTFDIIKTEKV